RRQVLSLPVPGERCDPPPRGRGVPALRTLVPAVAREQAREPGDLRGLGDDALRPTPLQLVLPVLYGQGLGHPRRRDPGRVGGAADQELLALSSAAQHHRPAPPARYDTDRGVPLPALRPRSDVGDVPGAARSTGRTGASEPPGNADSPR